jgi:hypothetical protein
MRDLFNPKVRNNKGKDFSRVDTSTQRGMGRFNSAGSGASGIGPRVGRMNPDLIAYVYNLQGVVDTNGNLLVVMND